MENQHNKPKNMKSFLSKKAVISFVFSKLAFLIFGILITTTFFFVLSTQKDMQDLDKIARTGEAITDITSAVSSSPFQTEVIYELDFKGNITVFNNSFLLESKGKKLTIPLYYPINTTEKFEFDSCLKIKKTNETVITKCQ